MPAPMACKASKGAPPETMATVETGSGPAAMRGARLAAIGEDALKDFLDGERLLEPSGDADGHAVVDAEGLAVAQREEVGEHRVVPHFGVHVQGKMAGVKGDVGADEAFDPLEEAAFEAERFAPEKAVMDEEDIGARLFGPADRFRAGVDGEGDFANRGAGPAHLDAVERIVNFGERVDLQQTAAPRVEFPDVHGGEYKIKEPFVEGG